MLQMAADLQWTVKGTLPDPACERRAARSTVIQRLVLRVCVAISALEYTGKVLSTRDDELSVGSICSAARLRSTQMLWRYDAACADAVVHGAPCLAQPGPLPVPVESDMPLHLRTRLACTLRSHGDEITVSTSPTFAHDVRTLCRLPSGDS